MCIYKKMASLGCDGYVYTDSPLSEALCLNREQCEDACDALGDLCVSIDMHKWIPRKQKPFNKTNTTGNHAP